MRTTRQRSAVAAALGELDGFTSAQRLHDALKARGEAVGLTTVYRHLQALTEAGEVDALRTDDGEVVYRAARRGAPPPPRVPHLRPDGRGERSGGRGVGGGVAAEHGFTEVTHTLEVFGTCRSC